jgi:hypothetical protein
MPPTAWTAGVARQPMNRGLPVDLLKGKKMSAEIVRNTGRLLEVLISGRLTFNEVSRIQRWASETIGREGKVRIFVIARDFLGWEQEGDWGDISFQMEHDRNIERMAIVGDMKWQAMALMFTSKGYRPFPIEFFSHEELDQARAWISQSGLELPPGTAESSPARWPLSQSP